MICSVTLKLCFSKYRRHVERLGFCLTGRCMFAQEPVAPIYVLTSSLPHSNLFWRLARRMNLLAKGVSCQKNILPKGSLATPAVMAHPPAANELLPATGGCFYPDDNLSAWPFPPSAITGPSQWSNPSPWSMQPSSHSTKTKHPFGRIL